MSQHAKWMDDPMVSHISKEKLEFLGELVAGGHGKSQKEMMPYMMSVMKKAKANGITFTPADIQTIITAIKKYSSPEELAKMDEIMKKAPHQK
ncbi:MAG: hypothetical protein IJ282_10930 [Lachnospiraceae bacterium]|nr:hypothetical protein [Lachnospiraceae bacterium]